MPRDTRLQKAMSQWGVCSRRKAEEYIQRGRVKVNGHPARLGDKIDPRKDLVTLDGERVKGAPKAEYQYLMLHKPRGY
ncbi:S4 domain-containing protein, partial [Bittarella massiliensis (ex Durand et al. 2017)]